MGRNLAPRSQKAFTTAQLNFTQHVSSTFDHSTNWRLGPGNIWTALVRCILILKLQKVSCIKPFLGRRDPERERCMRIFRFSESDFSEVLFLEGYSLYRTQETRASA